MFATDACDLSPHTCGVLGRIELCLLLTLTAGVLEKGEGRGIREKEKREKRKKEEKKRGLFEIWTPLAQ